MTRRRKRTPLPPAPPAFRADAIVLLLLVGSAGAGSFLLGQDANWDTQNYHYYNPWAWWSGRIFDWDVAAAQIQTYHNPVLDFPFLAMVTLAWPPRVIAFVLSIPTALAGFFVCKLAWILFGDVPSRQRAVAVACATEAALSAANSASRCVPLTTHRPDGVPKADGTRRHFPRHAHESAERADVRSYCSGAGARRLPLLPAG